MPTTPQDVKLRVIKSIVNTCSDMVYRAVPEVEPTLNVSKQTAYIIDTLIDITKMNHAVVPFDEHIEKFAGAMKKTLIYIVENDQAYAQLLKAAYQITASSTLSP